VEGETGGGGGGPAGKAGGETGETNNTFTFFLTSQKSLILPNIYQLKDTYFHASQQHLSTVYVLLSRQL
jgi:hypothetical protein